MHPAQNLLAGWESFYVIVGSSAAALTGLQFVVMALIAETTRRTDEGQFAAFATPTVVHFSGVLLTSSVLSAPWPSLRGAAVFLIVAGLAGVIYSAVVVVRARRQAGYQLVTEDWAFHAALPFVAYAASISAGALMARTPLVALFIAGGVQLLMLFVGIHNAWDTATFVALEHIGRSQRARAASGNGRSTEADSDVTASTTARS
ncbi:MAG TPA: hypothetical protein VM032_06945 [Vicinamibacterales bacterium]|nr:hypothetical protein [Vicinamibacterales bacterium]